MITEVKNETTTKVKKVKVKEFSATPEFQRSGEVEKQGLEFGFPEERSLKLQKSGETKKTRGEERKREVKDLQRKRSSGVAA